MRSTRVRRLSVVRPLLLASLGMLFAGSDSLADTSVHRFIWENDTFQSFGRSDRAYTNGMRFSVTHYRDDDRTTNLLERVSSSLMQWVDGPRRGTGWAIGQNMYTPSSISETVPDPTDRPYGGVLYFGAVSAVEGTTWNRQDYHRFELDVGVVGPPSLAEQSQKLAHEIVGATRPRGWNHQIPTHFAAGLLYDWFFQVIGQEPAMARRFSCDLLLNSGCVLGTVISDLHVGGMVRAGLNAYPLWPERIRPTYLDRSVGNGGNGDSWLRRVASGAWRHGKPNQLYVWAAASAKVSLGNVFIDEGLPHIRREYGLWDYSYGAAIGFGGHVEAAYQRVTRSKEFRTQTDENSFGSLSLAVIR